jgi:putative photosynthetic complex assembly protein 2
MASYLAPPVFAAFVWWFATGAVLLLVGMSARFHALRLVTAFGLVSAALIGLATSANDTSISGAYVAFTSTLLIWAAQEIAFLAGWLTGPRPQPCPIDAHGARRLGFALQAILYHELSLLACGLAVAILTWREPNMVALWTFASLWLLRQSSKINLFLGVPVTNDELMPAQVQFLKSYFVRKPVSAFFPLSVTLATVAMVILVQRIIDPAATPFEVAGLTLVSALFALGIVEHWFMLLPLPALTLWGWGMRSASKPETTTMDQPPLIKTSPASATHIATPQGTHHEPANAKACARQRLEDQFRRTFLEERARGSLTAALGNSVEPAVTVNGRTS